MFVHHYCAVWFGDWPELFITCIQHGDGGGGGDDDDDDDDDDDTGHPTPVWAIFASSNTTLFPLLCHLYHFSYLPRCVGKIVSMPCDSKMPTQWDLFDAGT